MDPLYLAVSCGFPFVSISLKIAHLFLLLFLLLSRSNLFLNGLDLSLQVGDGVECVVDEGVVLLLIAVVSVCVLLSPVTDQITSWLTTEDWPKNNRSLLFKVRFITVKIQ
jgi:hypothetical protein